MREIKSIVDEMATECADDELEERTAAISKPPKKDICLEHWQPKGDCTLCLRKDLAAANEWLERPRELAKGLDIHKCSCANCEALRAELEKNDG